MRRTVIAGLDGSPESLAAAGWAAREAMRRGVNLRLLHAVTPPPDGPHTTSAGLEALGWTSLARSAEALRETYPDLPITVDEVPGQPLPVLFDATEEAEVVVLGARGVSAAAGFLLGSVALTVAGQSPVPVVLVRAGEEPSDEHRLDTSGRPATATPYRDVVVGLDLTRTSDSVIEFAFDAAARRAANLRVIHGGDETAAGGLAGVAADLDPGFATPGSDRLTRALGPWQEKYPHTEVITEAVVGAADRHLIDAATDASLLVIGRRTRRSRVAPHIGSVAHTVLRHTLAPVAVVPHD